MKQQQSCKAKLVGLWSSTRSGMEQPMRLKAGWQTTHYHDFLSPSSSSSIIRSYIRLTKVAELSTLSSSMATETMDAHPENSKSEAAGEAISGNDSGTNIVEGDNISFPEVKRLMRLVNVEALKLKLGMEGKEMIGYSELLEACKNAGVARSVDEAITFAQALDEAGVVLIFRDKVYLHPNKVVDLVRRAVPLALTSEDDPRREELNALQKKKEEIDIQAHNQVRRILWSGLGLSVLQVSLFFRLTFWEFSWDVMEPIAFFATAGGIVVGYAYFLFTSRDPSYQDLRKRLFLSRQRKLFKKQNFDVDRFLELQKKCQSPLEEVPSPPL